GQSTEVFGDRIPALAEKKAEAEGLQRRNRTFGQRNDDGAEQDQYTQGCRARQLSERGIAEAKAVEHFGAATGRGRNHPSPLNCEVSHGSPPRGIHHDAPLPWRGSLY